MVKRRRVQLFSCHCADFAGCDRMYYIDVELFDKIVVTPNLDHYFLMGVITWTAFTAVGVCCVTAATIPSA